MWGRHFSAARRCAQRAGRPNPQSSSEYLAPCLADLACPQPQLPEALTSASLVTPSLALRLCSMSTSRPRLPMMSPICARREGGTRVSQSVAQAASKPAKGPAKGQTSDSHCLAPSMCLLTSLSVLEHNPTPTFTNSGFLAACSWARRAVRICMRIFGSREPHGCNITCGAWAVKCNSMHLGTARCTRGSRKCHASGIDFALDQDGACFASQAHLVVGIRRLAPLDAHTVQHAIAIEPAWDKVGGVEGFESRPRCKEWASYRRPRSRRWRVQASSTVFQAWNSPVVTSHRLEVRVGACSNQGGKGMCTNAGLSFRLKLTNCVLHASPALS